MTGLILAFAWFLTISAAALAVFACAVAVNSVDTCYVNMRARRAVPAAPGCPWCDDRACIDSTLCDCTGPCGRRYCKAPEVETVP